MSAQKTGSDNPRYHHGDLRFALIQAAKELLHQDGFENLTLREAARVVGVSHAAPYRHFSDKNELLAEIATGGFFHLKEALDKIHTPAQGDKLEELGFAYVMFAIQNAHLYRLMFGPQLQDKSPYPKLEQAAEDTFSVLVDLIERGQEEGYFKPGDSRERGTILWSLMHGLANLVIDGQVAPEHPTNLGAAVASFVRDALRP